jgi:hypothetical protein
MYQLKMLQDTLIQLDKKVIVVLAPGKGSFYPEFIPELYHKERGTINIDLYRQYMEQWQINCLDFHRYFIDNKWTAPYPLYPQYGIHWSYYGMCVVADSIVRYVEKLNHIEMPHIYWNDVKMSQPKIDDADISKAMNLLFVPRSFEMAYPKIRFEPDDGKTRPKLLVIADSFYWGIYNTGWSNLFTDDQFWYYNKDIYPGSIPIENINFLDEISKFDIIIILSTDANLPDFGWGFIENGYSAFFK